jgi:hypothetical protein
MRKNHKKPMLLLGRIHGAADSDSCDRAVGFTAAAVGNPATGRVHEPRAAANYSSIP